MTIRSEPADAADDQGTAADRPADPVRPLHRWDLSPSEAVSLQRELAERVSGELPADWNPKLVAGVDVTYRSDTDGTFTAGIVVLRLPGLETVEEVTADGETPFPYVPGLLSFREGPAVLAAVAKLTTVPDVFMFDGQGRAHPRRLGLASHLGLWLDKPTLGCAKTLLTGRYAEPGPKRGDFSPLTDRGEEIGRVLRTRDRVQPVYVSAGHRMTLDAAVKLVLACGAGYRLPEPTRRGHLLVSGAVAKAAHAAKVRASGH
jgi:deoxyribonuclease V